MTQDRIAYYTSRFTSESMTGIICAMYELCIEYIEEADTSGSVNCESARRASKVLSHFKDVLDFSYEISGNLFALYDFCERQIAKAMYTNDPQYLLVAKHIIEELKEAFYEVNKQDTSGSAMKNSQQITAGVTYGRSDLTEMMDVDSFIRNFIVQELPRT